MILDIWMDRKFFSFRFIINIKWIFWEQKLMYDASKRKYITFSIKMFIIRRIIFWGAIRKSACGSMSPLIFMKIPIKDGWYDYPKSISLIIKCR